MSESAIFWIAVFPVLLAVGVPALLLAAVVLWPLRPSERLSSPPRRPDPQETP